MCSRMAPSKLEKKFVTLTPRDAPKFLQKFFRSSNEPIAPYTRLFRAPRFDMLGPSIMTILCSRFEDRKPSADGKLVMRCSSVMRLLAIGRQDARRRPPSINNHQVNERRNFHNVRVGCAPCKGGAFQWVKIPPGNRSSRKQSEQSWRQRSGWSHPLARHELV